MFWIFTKRIKRKEQYLISFLLVLGVSGICYEIADFLGYRVIALILLLTVSLIAIFFDILPVLLSAALSAFNLLNNACLYANDNSKINVAANNHADILQLTIEDDGDGFPEEEIENVFDKFYRLKNARAGCTGLGLSIVKGFTEVLKGNVSLKNVFTGGSKFTIEIPCEVSYLKA